LRIGNDELAAKVVGAEDTSNITPTITITYLWKHPVTEIWASVVTEVITVANFWENFEAEA
jgi:hypothetical protein